MDPSDQDLLVGLSEHTVDGTPERALRSGLGPVPADNDRRDAVFRRHARETARDVPRDAGLGIERDFRAGGVGSGFLERRLGSRDGGVRFAGRIGTNDRRRSRLYTGGMFVWRSPSGDSERFRI